MPPSKQNKIKRSTFITEFSEYVEKLSCLSCKLIIVGDFNIVNDNERKQFYTLLETFGLVQRIDMPTYENGHLLDYIITRESPVTLHQSLQFLTKYPITWRFMPH